jgi:hypothetical protein
MWAGRHGDVRWPDPGAGCRLVAAVLSFYVLAAMIGLGLLGAGGVIWIWGRYG